MNIGYTMSAKRGDTDTLLHDVALRLLARGINAAGVVQVNSDRSDGRRCDMDVTVLPSGPVIRISQTLGTEARGCRLDTAALEDAVAVVNAKLSCDADVLLLNKFGKHEAEGRGFRETIADAIARDIPVLLGVNAMNFDAFLDFTGGMAVPLASDVDLLTNWVADIVSSQPAHDRVA